MGEDLQLETDSTSSTGSDEMMQGAATDPLSSPEAHYLRAMSYPHPDTPGLPHPAHHPQMGVTNQPTKKQNKKADGGNQPTKKTKQKKKKKGGGTNQKKKKKKKKKK